jgi:hypothetical protein
MQTIYFRTHNSRDAMSVEVNSFMAATVWELLSREFHMLSAQP